MSSLQQMRKGFTQLWNQISEGWQHLKERAGLALTHFRHDSNDAPLQTIEDRIMQNGSRWGLLAAELEEHTDTIVVRLEAPGMDADQFDISVIDNHLLIRGEKHLSKKKEVGRYHLMECAYGAFERAIALPVQVDDSKASARYKRGILTITLAKHAQSQRRRINVSH